MQPDVNKIGRDMARGFAITQLINAKSGISFRQQLERPLIEPGRVPELKCISELGAQVIEKGFQAIEIKVPARR